MRFAQTLPENRRDFPWERTSKFGKQGSALGRKVREGQGREKRLQTGGAYNERPTIYVKQRPILMAKTVAELGNKGTEAAGEKSRLRN